MLHHDGPTVHVHAEDCDSSDSASISSEDRVIYLKIASEGLSGTDSSMESGRLLRGMYATCLTQEGDGVGANGLLWSADEPSLTRTWTERRSNSTRDSSPSAFEHWYSLSPMPATKSHTVADRAGSGIRREQPTTVHLSRSATPSCAS